MSRSLRLGAVSALATLAAAAGLTPLFEGSAWFWQVALVVLLILGAGVGLRGLRAPAPLVAFGQLMVLLFAVVVFAGGDTTVAGFLPGTGTPGRLQAVLVSGGNTISQYAVPVPQTTGLVTLVLIGIGVAAVTVDVIAVSLRQTAAAGLPLLATYCVPAALAPEGLGWQYFALAGGGYLLLVAADSGERVRRWGQVLGPVQASGQPATRHWSPMSGGQVMAAVALVVAAVVPSLLPGLDERMMSRGPDAGTGGGGTINVINPILSLRDNLNDRSSERVIRYTTDQPAPTPLRIVTAGVFDGETWAPRTGRFTQGTVAEGLPQPPGLREPVQRQVRTTSISVGDLPQTYLPLPYPASSVEVPGNWLVEPDTLNVVGDDGLTARDLQYTVEHLEVVPTMEQLEGAGAVPPELAAEYTALPDDLPAIIEETAREVGGDQSNYEQALALQQWFRTTGGFQYSTNAPDDFSDDAVADFLVDREGYCVQFASAMAVMARSLGIPARMAVGFLPGTRAPNGDWNVTLSDAHTWPELYFEGVGWTRFEPTPATRAGAPPAWAVPPAEEPEDTPTTSTPTATPESRPSTPAASSTPSVQSSWAPDIDVPWRLVVAVLAAGVLVTAPLTARNLLARGRRRRAGDDPGAITEAAWTDMVSGAHDLGFDVPDAATPRQLAASLAQQAPFQGRPAASLAQLVAGVEKARYAPAGVASPPRRRLVPDVLGVLGEMAGRRRRWIARVAPRSVVAESVRRVGDAGRFTVRAQDQVARWQSRVAHGGRSLVQRRSPGRRTPDRPRSTDRIPDQGSSDWRENSRRG